MKQVAIAGTGFIAHSHARALLATGQRIAAVVSPGKTAAEAFAAAYGGASVYGDIRELPAGKLDAVHLCTPPATHPEQLRCCLKKGLAIVCEKPLLLCPEDLLEIEALLRERPVPLAVCFNNRFYPGLCELKRLLSAGTLGSLLLIQGRYEQSFHLPPVPQSWRFEAGAGNTMRAVTEIGSHLVDLLLYLCDSPVMQLSARFLRRKELLYLDEERILQESPGEGRTPFPVENEDAALISLELKDGTLVSFVLSEVSAGTLNHLELSVLGRAGRAAWDNQCPERLQLAFGKQRPEEAELGLASGVLDSYIALFTEFYSDRKAEKRFTDFFQAARNVRILAAAYASAREGGRWIGLAD